MKHINLQHEWMQLEKLGVPLAPMRHRVRPRQELMIREGDPRSVIFENRSGLIHCFINLLITSNLPRKTFLMKAGLDVPSLSSHFTWLAGEDDKGNPLQCYSFYDSGGFGPFPREGVINRHLNGGTPLKRGDFLRGLLLGCASISDKVPERLPQGCSLDAELTLWDHFDNAHSANLQLWLYRSAKSIGASNSKKPPASLLAGLQPNVEEKEA